MNFNGIPINQVSNTDAQGYADLNFLIPEVVREGGGAGGPSVTHGRETSACRRDG